MDKKYKKKGKRVIVRLLKIIFFAVLSIGAIMLGMLGGEVVSRSDTNIIRTIDVENFKQTLNRSMPIIDTIYNSGNISMSFSNEIRGIIKRMFEIDLNNPITILNAQSPFLYKYYTTEYQVLMKQREKEQEKVAVEDEGEHEEKEEVKVPDAPDSSPEDTTSPHYKEDASSITYTEEEKEHTDEGVITQGKIAIQNESKMKIDDKLIKKLLNEPLKISFNRKGPQILIYHTHTTEGYLKTLKDKDKKDVPNRTGDTRYNVVRVGQALYDSLRKKYGFNVIHNGTVNDYDFNNSYNTAFKTVTNILKGNPSIKVVFDIHRDGITADKPKLRVTSKVDGATVAQVMFVVGTSSRLSHPNWQENFKLALKLQEKLNTYYPGLARPINISSNRFNQHVTNGALIIEVGADGNTVDECVASTKYLARAIGEVLKEGK